MRKALIAVVMTTALAACGGGGGGSSTVTPQTPATSNPVVGGGGTTSSLATVTMKVKLYAPSSTSSAARSPKFVSSATKGVLVNVYSHADTAHATIIGTSSTDVSPGSAACGGATGTRVCTIVVPSPAGVDDFVFLTYDAAPVGTSFAAANQLGTGTVSAQTIAANSANTVNVAIGGAIASITASPPNLTFPNDGQLHSALVTVLAKDADGNFILASGGDPYVNPISAQSSDYTGPTAGAAGNHVVLNTYPQSGYFSACCSVVTLAQSTDTLYVTYDGKGSPGYASHVSLSAPSTATTAAVTGPTVVVSPIYVTSASTYVNPGFPPTVNFTATGQTANFVVYENGGSHTFTTSGCAGVATATVPGSPTIDPSLGFNESFTITAAGNGTCTLNVIDTLVSYSITVNVSNGATTTTTTIGIPGTNPVATTIPVPASTNGPVTLSMPSYNGYAATVNLNTANNYVYWSAYSGAALTAVLSDAPPSGMPLLVGTGVHNVLQYGALQGTSVSYTDYYYTKDTISFTSTAAPSGTYHLALYNSQYPAQAWLIDPFGTGTVSGNTISFVKPTSGDVYHNGFNGFSFGYGITYGWALYQ